MTDRTDCLQEVPQEQWPPLIYNAHIPWYIRVRDFVITSLGWLLIVDLLEDIWVLFTQWLNITVFKRTVALEHLLQTLWDNIHQFFYLSFAFAAVILLVGMSRYRELRKPMKNFAGLSVTSTGKETKAFQEDTVPRMMRVSFDNQGNMLEITAVQAEQSAKPSQETHDGQGHTGSSGV